MEVLSKEFKLCVHANNKSNDPAVGGAHRSASVESVCVRACAHSHSLNSPALLLTEDGDGPLQSFLPLPHVGLLLPGQLLLLNRTCKNNQSKSCRQPPTYWELLLGAVGTHGGGSFSWAPGCSSCCAPGPSAGSAPGGWPPRRSSSNLRRFRGHVQEGLTTAVLHHHHRDRKCAGFTQEQEALKRG